MVLQFYWRNPVYKVTIVNIWKAAKETGLLGALVAAAVSQSATTNSLPSGKDRGKTTTLWELIYIETPLQFTELKRKTLKARIIWSYTTRLPSITLCKITKKEPTYNNHMQNLPFFQYAKIVQWMLLLKLLI